MNDNDPQKYRSTTTKHTNPTNNGTVVDNNAIPKCCVEGEILCEHEPHISTPTFEANAHFTLETPHLNQLFSSVFNVYFCRTRACRPPRAFVPKCATIFLLAALIKVVGEGKGIAFFAGWK